MKPQVRRHVIPYRRNMVVWEVRDGLPGCCDRTRSYRVGVVSDICELGEFTWQFALQRAPNA